MREQQMGCVIVLNGDKVSAILTERDLLFGAAGEDNSAMKVRDVMHKDPVCLKADDPVSFAFHHMSVGGYRHLPVYNGEHSVGMISARDLLRYLTDPKSDS
jgi:CBS domain-containing protein